MLPKALPLRAETAMACGRRDGGDSVDDAGNPGRLQTGRNTLEACGRRGSRPSTGSKRAPLVAERSEWREEAPTLPSE